MVIPSILQTRSLKFFLFSMRSLTSESADTPSQINPVLSIVQFNPTESSEFAALVHALLLTSNWTQNSKMCNLILDFRPKLPNVHSNPYHMQMSMQMQHKDLSATLNDHNKHKYESKTY